MNYLIVGLALLLGGCATAPETLAEAEARCVPIKAGYENDWMAQAEHSICVNNPPVRSMALGRPVGDPAPSVVVVVPGN